MSNNSAHRHRVRSSKQKGKDDFGSNVVSWTTKLKEPRRVPSKTERLLDMLSAWADYYDLLGRHDEARKVADVYQKVGDLKDNDEAITIFITNNVLPLILEFQNG